MIRLECEEVVGWKHAIRGMRNPMNSWDKSDSWMCGDKTIDCSNCPLEFEDCSDIGFDELVVGDNDLSLMTKLRNAGTDHRKFMRMIVVYLDITAPLYWWKEFDTYKVGTVANSCSTMHKIQAKEFTLDDFSCEHLFGDNEGRDVDEAIGVLNMTIDMLNTRRVQYLETKDKEFWWEMIQLLPSSYNQRRTILLNYEVLANIYKSRKNHKLDEWRTFCKWIKSLPHSELITGGE
jgi:hypothetical protein